MVACLASGHVTPNLVNFGLLFRGAKNSNSGHFMSQRDQICQDLSSSSMARANSTSQWVFTARLRLQFRMPPVRNARELRSHHDTASPVQLQYPGERRAAAAVPLPESPYRGKLQNVSPPSVLFESSRIFFTIHRRHRRKNDGPEF